MKESEKKVIEQEAEAYDDHHKKVRMRNISLGIMAAVVCVGVGLGLRMYGHAVTDGEVDGLVVEEVAYNAETVSDGDLDIWADLIEDPTYVLTSRECTVGGANLRMTYSEETQIPDQVDFKVAALSGDALTDALTAAQTALGEETVLDLEKSTAYTVSFAFGEEVVEITPELGFTFTYPEGTFEDGTTLPLLTIGETATVLPAATVTANTFTINSLTAPTTLVVGQLASEEEFTYNETSKVYEDDTVKITVAYTADAMIPDQAELVVTRLTDDQYDTAVTQAQEEIDSILSAEDTYAYDIKFVYEETEIEPVAAVNVTFSFKDEQYEDGDNLTVIHLGDENTEVMDDVTVENGESSIEAGSFSTYVITKSDNSTTEVYNLADKIKSLTVTQSNGTTWETATTYNAEKNFRVNMSFNTFDLGNSTSAAVELDSSWLQYIDVDKLEATTGDVTIDGENAATMSIVKDSAGKYYAVFTFDKNYLKTNGTILKNGSAYIECTWKTTQLQEGDNSVDITIGSQTNKITVNKTTTSSGNGYNVSKCSTGTSYDYDTDEIIFTWEIKVEVTEDKDDEAITIQDLPDTTGLNTNGISGFSYTATLKSNSTKSAASAVTMTKNSAGDYTFTIGDTTNEVAAGWYYITYETAYSVKTLQGQNLTVVNNTYKFEGKTETSPRELNRNWIKKTGTAVNNNTTTAGTIDWEVTINSGDDYYYLSGTVLNFFDKIPDGQTLDESSIKIKKYKYKNQEVENSISSTYTNGVLSATLDEGYYKYVITYTTTCDDLQAGGSIDVPNTAKVGDHSADCNVNVSKKAITKTPGTATQVGETTTYKVPFTVKIGEAIAANTVYTDGVYLNWSNVSGYTTDRDTVLSELELSSVADLELTITETNKTEPLEEGDGKDYKLTLCDSDIRTGDSYTDIFQIKFLKDFSDGVEISYSIKVKTNGTDGFALENDFAGAQTQGQCWSLDSKKYLKKSGSSDVKWNENGDTIITWEITAYPDATLTDIETFTDTLQKGLEFIPYESTANHYAPFFAQIFYDVLDENGNVTSSNQNKVVCIDYKNYSYEKSTNVLTMTLDFTKEYIGQDAYNQEEPSSIKVTSIYLKYQTKVTDDSWLLGDKKTQTFTNKVKWGNYDASATSTVTRNVLEKEGEWDSATNSIKYTITINEKGADLSADDYLTLTDTMNDKNLAKLTSVALYKLNSDGTRTFQYNLQEVVSTQTTPAIGTYSLNDVNNGEWSSQTITAYVPDSTPCLLVYTYTFYATIADGTEFTNTATLKGTNEFSSGSNKFTYSSASMGGSFDTSTCQVMLYKIDSKTSANIEGAGFTLWVWDETNNDWSGTAVATKKTSSTGFLSITGLERGKIYRLEETSAAAGYELPAAGTAERYQYFAFAEYEEITNSDATVTKSTTNSENAINQIIADYSNKFVFDSSKSNWSLITDTDQKVMYYQAWTNEPLKAKIVIKKLWKYSSDNSDASSVMSDAYVTVDLYRQEVLLDTNSTQPLVLNPSAISGLINTDGSLTTDYESFKANHSSELIKEGITVAKRNDGTWYWDSNQDGNLTLDRYSDDGQYVYQYYAVETAYDTKSSTIQVIGVAAYDSTVDTLGTTGTITITNKVSASYTLPKTGGSGTPLEQIISWVKNLFSF